MERFSELRIKGWRQFEDVNIDLRNQVTIITGQNGTGKTSLLNVLGRHFGWELNFVSTPRVNRRNTRVWSDSPEPGEEIDDQVDTATEVGSIEYSNGATCKLTAKTIVESQYHLGYVNQQNVVGLHIPSHRPVATYTAVANIPTNPTTAAQ